MKFEKFVIVLNFARQDICASYQNLRICAIS